jgi:hypothetical protein
MPDVGGIIKSKTEELVNWDGLGKVGVPAYPGIYDGDGTV